MGVRRLMDEPQDPQVRNVDARSLRGLAHPLRMRLLDALRFGGSGGGLVGLGLDLRLLQRESPLRDGDLLLGLQPGRCG